MNLQTFKNRTQANTVTIEYSLALEAITTLNKVRPVYYRGRGKWASKVDRLNELTTILDNANVEYIVGNDAPKGGQTGTYVLLTKKGVKNTFHIRKELSPKQEKQVTLEASKPIKVPTKCYPSLEAFCKDANRVHPAPANVQVEKDNTGLSWKTLYRMYGTI